MKYFYKDENRKIHFTRGKFKGWTEPTGLLKVPYAIFALKSEMMFIPIYDLPRETRKVLAAVEEFDRHTAEPLFCSDLLCECHDLSEPVNMTAYMEHIGEPFLAGLITWGEMWMLFRGRQI